MTGTRFSGEPPFLLDVADSWARHVLRLAQEAATPPPQRLAWSIYDYIAALHIRDRLQEGLKTPEGSISLPGVAVADELLVRFTRPDETGALGRCGVVVHTDPWWWRRVPAAGPAADDLKGFVGG